VSHANALQWDGGPGHYEVYYVTTTDTASGTGFWIRLTMRAPTDGSPGECALWFLAMTAGGERTGRKQTLPLDAFRVDASPFRVTVGDAHLTDTGTAGAFEDVSWDLTWTPRLPAAELVHPTLRRLGVAKTVYTVPHPDVAIDGTLTFAGRTVTLDGAAGDQAHVHGSQHAERWAWTHSNAFTTLDGEPVADTFFEGASVYVPRFGREIGPSSPIVTRVRGEDRLFTAPHVITRTTSRFALTTWHAEATRGRTRVVVEIDAPRDSLVGVTYHDPDGREAYCYNSEVASMRMHVWDRTGRGLSGWSLHETLLSDGQTHFEYAQREPVHGVPLLTT